MNKFNLTENVNNSSVGRTHYYNDLKDPGVNRSVSPYTEPGFKSTGDKDRDKIRYNLYCSLHPCLRDLF